LATLVLPSFGVQPAADFVVSASSLSEWLVNDWALLFSHPQDFRNDSIEADRWLSIMHDEFLDRGVRPLALSRSPLELDRGWVSEIIADESPVTLDSNRRSSAADTLRHQLDSQHGRYVVIIDPELEQRGVLRYMHVAPEPLSPLDLLHSVDAMRRWSAPACGWAHQRRSFIPC
jgi:alkyl hydroperoxide reductase subunit AhpC